MAETEPEAKHDMSKSAFIMGVEFHMLDARKECVPGFEDWSSGHITFKTKFRSKAAAPGSWVIDDQYGEVTFNKEKWAEHCAREIIEDLTFDDNRKLRRILVALFEQARAHCDEHHADIRERFKHAPASPDSAE